MTLYCSIKKNALGVFDTSYKFLITMDKSLLIFNFMGRERVKDVLVICHFFLVLLSFLSIASLIKQKSS